MRMRLPSRGMVRSGRMAYGMSGIAGFLAIWAVAALLPGQGSLLPSPWAVSSRFLDLMVTQFAGDTLGGHLVASLVRFGIAYGLALAVGIPLGLAMGWSSTLGRIVNPIFNALRFIAPIAWVPFAVLWFGTGLGGPVLVIFAGAFPPCLLSAWRGARQVPLPLLEAARMLGTPGWRVILEVLLPATLPSLVAGARVAAGTAWQSLIGAELIVVSSGIGYLMVQGQSQISTTTVMSGMIAIGIVGIVLDAILKTVESHVKARRGLEG